MALTSEQIAVTAEIVRESYTSVASAVTSLNAAQESLLSDDLDTWERIRDKHTKLKGGSDGLDIDPERKRAAIFYRVRYMLGFEFETYSPDGAVLELFELEVGSNFG